MMNAETARALKDYFGYVPNEDDGEQWCVYQDNHLIVVHCERKPRIYRRGCKGLYYEIEPLP